METNSMTEKTYKIRSWNPETQTLEPWREVTLTQYLAEKAASERATKAIHAANVAAIKIRLSDPRSTIVGYGRICADHFGLPWGSDKHAFAPVQTEVGARSLMEMAKALEMRS
jgi:hypothetical protein